MIHTNKWRAKPVAPVLKHMLGAFKCNAIFNATFQQQNGEESTTNNDNKKSTCSSIAHGSGWHHHQTTTEKICAWIMYKNTLLQFFFQFSVFRYLHSTDIDT